LLKARAAQARQAVLLEGALPGPALLLGQLVALQRLFEGDAAGAQRTYSAGIRPKTFRQFWNRVLYDSPLEEAGFELSVPPERKAFPRALDRFRRPSVTRRQA
jgi:hypothetical protein